MRNVMIVACFALGGLMNASCSRSSHKDATTAPAGEKASSGQARSLWMRLSSRKPSPHSRSLGDTATLLLGRPSTVIELSHAERRTYFAVMGSLIEPMVADSDQAPETDEVPRPCATVPLGHMLRKLPYTPPSIVHVRADKTFLLVFRSLLYDALYDRAFIVLVLEPTGETMRSLQEVPVPAGYLFTGEGVTDGENLKVTMYSPHAAPVVHNIKIECPWSTTRSSEASAR